jgi:hypothetical protein
MDLELFDYYYRHKMRYGYDSWKALYMALCLVCPI